MAVHISNRNSYKEARNYKRQQEMPTDEIALRDEILELKREVMILRRTNEHNLVKFRKYEDEAKRKDREIEQLMDPRKNADITKVLSTKGVAILMTLKDQNNALIQMVLNKDVQIKRLLSEMKMSKLYASTRKTVSYKEEIVRLKNLLVKSQEKLRENLNKENQTKSMSANESSVLEFSSSSGQSSPRDLDELRMVIRSLEAHLKYSNDLLNRKDREISFLTDELNFLKKLLQHKTSKKKTFDCHPDEAHKYSIRDTHSVPQTCLDKMRCGELLEPLEKSEDKNLPSSAPASSTRLPPCSHEFIPKYKSLSSITGGENWRDLEVKSVLCDTTAGESINEENVTRKFEKTGRIRTRKKHRDPKKKIPRKFSGRSSTKRKKIHESERKNRNTSMLEASKEEEIKENGQMISEIFKIKGSKEKETEAKTEEIFSETENRRFDDSTEETEEVDGIKIDGTHFTGNCDLEDVKKESETPKSLDHSSRNSVIEDGSEANSEIIEVNSPVKEENCETSAEDTKPFSFRREIYLQSFDSSFESENGNPGKQEVQQVQVEVQINSIFIQSDEDELGNSLWENSHQEEFTGTKADNCAPDDWDNNDDDNDVITR